MANAIILTIYNSIECSFQMQIACHSTDYENLELLVQPYDGPKN